jgi:hypothetical protein
VQATDRSAKALKYKAADGSVISFREVSIRLGLLVPTTQGQHNSSSGVRKAQQVALGMPDCPDAVLLGLQNLSWFTCM